MIPSETKEDNLVNTYGILLPCDGSEPMPISVGDYKHINELVGGNFDCVRSDFDPSNFGEDEGKEILGEGEHSPFVAVAYVHDEGVLLQLPINAMASVVLRQPIFGPCVLVSGTSPNGFYDGDNHDVPEWFANAVFKGGLYELSEVLTMVAETEAEAMELAINDGLFTPEQASSIMRNMMSDDPAKNAVADIAVGIAMAYAEGRRDGTLPKFERSEFLEFQETLTIKDEDIAKFWEEEGGK